MRITSTNRNIIEEMGLFSGTDKQTIRNFFESLISIVILDYIEGETTNIPFLGTIKIEYKGEKLVEGEKEADIVIAIEPENTLLKNIGQIKDKVESDIEKMIKTRMVEDLRSYLK